MKTSQQGIDLIKNFESFRSRPYLDMNNVPTIGYGSTRLENGSRVTMANPEISLSRADSLLRLDVSKIEAHILKVVKVPLNQGQFDALVSFVYNLGPSAFDNSTLLKKLNASDYSGASAEFSKWDHDDGKVVIGLERRRLAEQALFNEVPK
jgi:lysozyme